MGNNYISYLNSILENINKEKRIKYIELNHYNYKLIQDFLRIIIKSCFYNKYYKEFLLYSIKLLKSVFYKHDIDLILNLIINNDILDYGKIFKDFKCIYFYEDFEIMFLLKEFFSNYKINL